MLTITRESIGKYRKQLSKLTNTFETQKRKTRIKSSMMTTWSKDLPDDYQVIIAKLNDEIIGWGCGEKSNYFPKHKTMFVGIYVLPDLRGKGYGKAIGKELFQLALDQGFTRIFMNFRNDSAKRLYNSIVSLFKVKRKPFSTGRFYNDSEYKLVKLC